jgi:hypothetical protein
MTKRVIHELLRFRLPVHLDICYAKKILLLRNGFFWVEMGYRPQPPSGDAHNHLVKIKE